MIDEKNFLNYKDKITPEWLAGFFDGEGYIHASLNNHGYVALRVGISQKNMHILLLIMIKFPGRLCTHKTGSIRGCHSLVWNGKDCINILKYIKDYSIGKHEVIEIGLKLAESLLIYSRNDTPDQQMKKDLMNEIASFNESNRNKTYM